MKSTFDRLLSKLLLHPHIVEDVEGLQTALNDKVDINTHVLYLGHYWSLVVEAVTNDLVLYKYQLTGMYYGWEEVYRWSYTSSSV